jgi:hypothetical protein
VDEHARAVSGLLFQLARRGGDGVLAGIDETSGELAQRSRGATRNCSNSRTVPRCVNATTATVSACSRTSQSDSVPSGSR